MKKTRIIRNDLSNKDMIVNNEKFIKEYANNKGWDYKNLSPNQILEICQQKEYLKRN
jgi:hypothetical protein